MVERDNVRDHRAGTIDRPLQKHAQVRLRVHHIVIRRGEFKSEVQRMPKLLGKEDFARCTPV